jgi:hypothetical protein
VRGFLLGLALLSVAGCVSESSWAAIERAASEFHERQANGDDQAIFDAASQGFRDNSTVSDLRRLNEAVRRLSDCTASVRDSRQWRSNQTTAGHFVMTVYTRSCPGGELVETLTFSIEAGAARLHGYNVAGMALFPPEQPPPTAPQGEPAPPLPRIRPGSPA